LKLRYGNASHPTESAFRATSKRTRIETISGVPYQDAYPILSEQHPREQGLKHSGANVFLVTNVLSEQHPREQGLKLYPSDTLEYYLEDFQSNIQENKD